MPESQSPRASVTIAQVEPPCLNFDPALPNVPGYAVTREIARGGMAVVYAALDPVFEREVAVKVMLPEQDVGQFVVESKVTAQLPHPGIPPVHALGRVPDGRPFLVMKLIRGQTLANEIIALREQRAPHAEFLDIFEQICLTVGFAHSKGIVHRDLKPGNVMVGKFGEVQVMDWGLAKQIGPGRSVGAGDTERAAAPAEVAATLAGQVKGTPSFMAPEQARGEPVDARADVFALGGILAAMLTGRPPFVGATVVDTIIKAAQAELDECFGLLEECRADKELVAVARCCLATHPDDRFPDATALADEIADYRFGVEERLRRAERERAAQIAEARERRKRRRVQFALVGAVLLLTVGGVAFGWWDERQASQRKTAASEQQLKDERAAAEARERTQRNAATLLVLLEQCEQALTREDTARAAAAFAEIERRVAEGGAESLRPRVERCRAELRMLKELDRIDNMRWTLLKGKWQYDRIPGECREAFRQFGVTVGTTPPAAAARRLNESLVRERLLQALELWFVLERSAEMLALLDTVDADPFRSAVRQTVLEHDGRIRALMDQPEAMKQPTRFTVAQVLFEQISVDRRSELLHVAHRRQPDNFAVLMAMVMVYTSDKEKRVEERIAWCRAALAARPTNAIVWNNLGVALSDKGDTGGAVSALEEAVKYDREDAAAWSNLGDALLSRPRPDWNRIEAAFREATRLAPSNAEFWFNLGVAMGKKGSWKKAQTALEKTVDIDPQFAQAHFLLGIARQRGGDLDGAIEAVSRAVKLEPNNAEYAKKLAELKKLAEDKKSKP